MSVPIELRMSLLEQFGNFAIAYSVAAQPGLDHFGDARGFLAYAMVGRTAMVLANPVAPPEHYAGLIGRFVEQKRDVCFVQVSRPVATILASKGFLINEMGIETKLDLPNHSIKGPHKRNFRTAVKRMTAQGNSIRELASTSLDEREVRVVSDRWRRTRATKSREIAFLARPIVFGDEPGVRKFWSFDRAGKLIAFAFFDPIYDRGEVVGYLNSARRRLPEAEPLVTYAIIQAAIETFRGEQKKWLSIGISPFAQIHDNDFQQSRFVKRAFRLIYRNSLFNRMIYPLQGLAKHKAGYGGISEPTYFAFNTPPPLPRLIKMLRVTKVL
jgi:lysylphosphatidylglycerol synthetase-like protein (DUF2156 family)